VSDINKLEQDLQKVLSDLANEMKSIGNGYGWTVEESMNVILPVLKEHIAGFNPANVVVDCKDF
jgi:hypothetical protein